MPVQHRRLCLVLVLSISVTLLGCTAQSEIVDIPLDAPEAFSFSGAAEPSSRWWTSFGDDGLNAAVDEALEENFDLATAWHRLRAAQAIVDRESAALWPWLEGSAQGQVTRGEARLGGPEDLELGLSANYEADLWGRIRSLVEAEQFRAEASQADYQAAAVSLSAEVARTWYRLGEAASQLDLVEAQIATNVELLELIENRFEAGQIPAVDLLRQRQLVEATREQRTRAVSNVEVLENQLAVLLGRAPQLDVEFAPADLPELPPLPETGVPIELVRRRPDIRSARLLVRAADRDLASAISSRYPRLSLSAASTTTGAQNLFRQWIHSFAGSLLAPIFYGGELSAQVDVEEAVQHQRLLEYGQTVLVAFQEVEDALARESAQVDAIQSLEMQLELAQQSYDQLRIQYLNGAGNYLDVLTALGEVQELRRNFLTAELALIEYRIALYRSLAGAFDTDREGDE